MTTVQTEINNVRMRLDNDTQQKMGGFSECKRVIQKLRRMAIKLHRQYEVYCNGPTDQHIIKAERIASDLEWKICEIVTNLGLNCFFQRDPRGGTLYISKDYLNDQNYDSKGIFVA